MLEKISSDRLSACLLDLSTTLCYTCTRICFAKVVCAVIGVGQRFHFICYTFFRLLLWQQWIQEYNMKYTKVYVKVN